MGKKRKKSSSAEQILISLLNSLDDFEAILKAFTEFNAINPPLYFTGKQKNVNPITLSNGLDYKPMTPAGAWLRKPWKPTIIPDYRSILGGGRPLKTIRSKKVDIDEERLSKILQGYTVTCRKLSYRNDWPAITRKYHGVKTAVSKKKIDQLYNYAKNKFWTSECNKVNRETSEGREFREVPVEEEPQVSITDLKSSTEEKNPQTEDLSTTDSDVNILESNTAINSLDDGTDNDNDDNEFRLHMSPSSEICDPILSDTDSNVELLADDNNRYDMNRMETDDENFDVVLEEPSKVNENLHYSTDTLIDDVVSRARQEMQAKITRVSDETVKKAFLRSVEEVCGYSGMAGQPHRDGVDSGNRKTNDGNFDSGTLGKTPTAKHNETHCSHANSNSPLDLHSFLSSTVIVHKDKSFWKEMTITETKSGRRLGGDWTDKVVQQILSKYNICCTWKFTRNYVRVSKSRKQGPFICCKAVCTIQDCPVSVTLLVREEGDDTSEITFSNVPRHPEGHLSARKIKGSKREEYCRLFKENHNLQPSDLYREKLTTLSDEQYISGNRDTVGLSTNTFRVMASRARKGQTKGPAIHENIMKIKEELAKIDEKQAIESGQVGRNFWGSVHHSFVSDKEMRVVLLDEPMVRLFKSIRAHDTLFIDATGSIIKPVHGFSRILHYAIVVRHPFSAAPPLPIAEYVTNEHTVESIGYFLRTLCGMERKIYGQSRDGSKCRFMMDFSAALIIATIDVFNKETLTQYLDRTMKIAQGEASATELEKSYITICCAHIMQMVKRAAKKYGNSTQSHMALRFVGRMLHVETLAEALAIFRSAYIIFKSKYVTEQLQAACADMEKHVNTFKFEIEEAIDEADTCIKETDQDLDGCEDDEPCLKTDQSASHKFWLSEIMKCETALKIAKIQVEKRVRNKYYCPDFLQYFQDHLLPSITLWSHLMCGDLSRFSGEYNKPWCSEIVESTTNGHVERYFGMITRPWEKKIPLELFIRRKWEQRIGFRRQFADAILLNVGKGKVNRLLNVYKRNMNWIAGANVIKERKNDIEESEKRKIPEVEERWQPKRSKKRKKGVSYYQSPPKMPVHFSPISTQKEEKRTSNGRRSSQNFRNFRKVMWNSLASKFSSYRECTEELNLLWKNLPDDEKHIYDSDPAEVCNSCKAKDSDCIDWVACDICDKWYHCDCVGRLPAMTEAVPFYHCPQCLDKLCRSLVNYVHVFRGEAVSGKQNNINRVIQRWSAKSKIVKTILELQDNRNVRKHLDIRCYSKRGFVNEGANCWLNSVMQILCGSAIKALLPFELTRKVPLMKSITTIQNQLQKDGKPISTAPLLEDIATIIGMPLHRKQQEDAAEGYTSILTKLFSHEESLLVHDHFTNTKVNLTICLNCQYISGSHEQEFVTIVDTIRCTDNDTVGIDDLIWNEFFGKYELNDMYSCPKCRVSTTKDKSILAKFFLNAPDILAFMIRRCDTSSTQVNKTRVIPTTSLDLRHHIAGIDPTVPYNYELCGLIVHKGRSASSGHFISHVVNDSDRMVTIDDDKIMHQSLDDVCLDRYTQKNVHMLFYARKDRYRSEPDVASDTWQVPSKDALLINKLICEDDESSSSISHHDMQSIFGTKLLNDNVVNSFITNFAENCSEFQSIYATSSYFFADIISGKTDSRVVQRTLGDIATTDADLIVVPIHQYGHPGHWTVAGIFPSCKIIVHCDSLHEKKASIFKMLLSTMKTVEQNPDFKASDWLLLSPTGIDRQADAMSCGIYACINAANLMSFETRKIKKEKEFLDARYWVAKYAIASPADRLHITKKSHKGVKTKWQNIEKAENVNIKTTVCDGEEENFFEDLRYAVRVRRKSAMNLAEDQNVDISDEENKDTDLETQLSNLLVCNIVQLWTSLNELTVESSTNEVLRILNRIKDGYRDVLRSERVQAFYAFDINTYRRLSTEEMQHISMRVEELEFYDDLFQMVTSIAMDAVNTGKVLTRGLNSIDFFYMVVFPEVLWTYVKAEFNLNDHEATRYLYGTTCQVVYHPWLRLKDNHITRSTKATSKKESIFPIIQNSSGEMQIEFVGAVVLREEKRFTELQEKRTVNHPPVTITDSKRAQQMRIVSSNNMKCCFTMLFSRQLPMKDPVESTDMENKLDNFISFTLEVADMLGLRSVAIESSSSELASLEKSIANYFKSRKSSNVSVIRLLDS